MSERRQATRYPVNWQGRALLADRSLYQISIKDVSKGGVGILFEHTLALNTPINIEFHVRCRGELARIRAKTKVAHNTVLSSGNVKLGLLFVEISRDCVHTLNNALQELSDRQG